MAIFNEMERNTDGTDRIRYLSTMRDLADQGIRALRGASGLPEMRIAPGRVTVRIPCRACSDAEIGAEFLTLSDAGDTGFAVWSHCGITERTESIPRHILDMLIMGGASVHPSSRPRLHIADYLALKDALAATDFPQEELC